MKNSFGSRRKNVNHYFASSDIQGEKYAATFLGAHWMTNKYIYEPKEHAFLNWKAEITTDYEKLVANRPDIQGIAESSYQSVFRRDILKEYNFFAEYGAPAEVFQYVDSEGNIAHFNEEQLRQLAEWDGKSSIFGDLEVHHLIPRRNLSIDNSLNINPDNGLLTITTAHIPHLHQGNTSNPTPQMYLDTKLTGADKLDLTINYNQDLMTLNMYQYGGYVAAGSAIIAFTLTTVIQYYKLRKDPRPWRINKGRMLQESLAAAGFAAPLACLGFGTRQAVANAISNLPEEVADTVFMDILSYNAGFLVVGLASNIGRNLISIKDGQNKTIAIKSIKSYAIIASGEFLAFQLLGVAIDTFAVDLVSSTQIPEPSIVFARILYSTIKFAKSIKRNKDEKNAAIEIKVRRQAHLFKEALDYTKAFATS